ncbi:hypothetical protein TrVGV298_008782 [Trichoderma virens]|nr:hypothetical protein TrVGV298_008782 [Trichoderma virens]
MKVGGVQPRLPKRAVLQTPVELKDLQPAPHTVFHEVPRLSALDTLAVQAAVLRRYHRRLGRLRHYTGTQLIVALLLLLPKVTPRAGASVEDPARALARFSPGSGSPVCTSTSSVLDMISRDQPVNKAGSSVSRRLALSEISAHNNGLRTRYMDMPPVGSSRNVSGSS